MYEWRTRWFNLWRFDEIGRTNVGWQPVFHHIDGAIERAIASSYFHHILMNVGANLLIVVYCPYAPSPIRAIRESMVEIKTLYDQPNTAKLREELVS